MKFSVKKNRFDIYQAKETLCINCTKKSKLILGAYFYRPQHVRNQQQPLPSSRSILPIIA